MNDDKELHQVSDKLWKAFLSFSESQSEIVSVARFVSDMAIFISKMAFDCAPSQKIARSVLEGSIQIGQQWSLKEKENEE